MTHLPLILIGVFLNSFAQLMLKLGMRIIGYFEFSLNNIIPIGIQVLKNPFIMLGISSYIISIVIWLMVLSRVDVSFAYPMISIGYILTAFIGYFILQEHFSAVRIIGILVIICGVYLVSKS